MRPPDTGPHRAMLVFNISFQIHGSAGLQHCFFSFSPSKGGTVPRKWLCVNGGWSQSCCPSLGHSTQSSQGYTSLCFCQDWPFKWWKLTPVHQKAPEHPTLVFKQRIYILRPHYYCQISSLPSTSNEDCVEFFSLSPIFMVFLFLSPFSCLIRSERKATELYDDEPLSHRSVLYSRTVRCRRTPDIAVQYPGLRSANKVNN